jgi:hypothetical protein
MKKFNIKTTWRGNDPYSISLGNDTNFSWEFHQINVHCQATFTDPSTISLQIHHHESSAYNSLLLQTSLSTATGVLQDLLWVPDRPITLFGKDAVIVTFAGVSTALQFGISAVVAQ